MTQRRRGIADGEATGLAREIFDSPNQLLGRTANLLRILAHSPYLARWFLPFVAAAAPAEHISMLATSEFGKIHGRILTTPIEELVSSPDLPQASMLWR